MNHVTTPELAIAVGPLSNLLKAADQGIADIDQGKLVIGASNGMCRVVKTDTERRLAAHKIAAIEAKMIEGEASDRRQIAA